jgi:type IX secretion system PorP/SprF family membrane protein
MKFKLILLLLLTFTSIIVKAQDPVFTQYFFMPETLNPAFTGTLNSWYTGIIHRTQWPDGNKKLLTEYAFVNGPLDEEGKTGIGISFLNHHEVFTNYNYSEINAAYAYSVLLDGDWKLRLGMNAGYGHKNFNFSNLLLEDQINTNTGFTTPNTTDPYVLNSSNSIDFLDISSGLLLYKDETWFGVGLKHLNRPDISFVENGNVPLNMFLTLHGGYAFSIDNSGFLFAHKSNLLITANYMKQSQYNRLDLGTALEFDKFVFGATAVTNPKRKTNNSSILTSINLFSSIQLDRFVFGYSYDINMSKFGNSLGIHELTLSWQIGRPCSSCDSYLVKRPWGRNY